MISAEVFERRSTPRWPGRHEHHPFTAARLRPGRDITLINLSTGGALVESGSRLLPGTRVDLQLLGSGIRRVVRGRVLRCHVCALRGDGVLYRGAVMFEEHLAWQRADVPTTGYSIPRDNLAVSAGLGSCYPTE
jgi:hypothetical protein